MKLLDKMFLFFLKVLLMPDQKFFAFFTGASFVLTQQTISPILAYNLCHIAKPNRPQMWTLYSILRLEHERGNCFHHRNVLIVHNEITNYTVIRVTSSFVSDVFYQRIYFNLIILQLFYQTGLGIRNSAMTYNAAISLFIVPIVIRCAYFFFL